MNNHRIAVMGQGYVGLPLALEFASIFRYTDSILIQTGYKNLIPVKIIHWKLTLHLLSEVINEANASNFSKGYIASSTLDTIKDANVLSLLFLHLLINSMPRSRTFAECNQNVGGDFKERRH